MHQSSRSREVKMQETPREVYLKKRLKMISEVAGGIEEEGYKHRNTHSLLLEVGESMGEKKKHAILDYAKLEQPLYAVVMTFKGKPKLVEAQLTNQTHDGKIRFAGEALNYMNIGSEVSVFKIKLFQKSKKAAWNRFAREKWKEAKELQKQADMCRIHARQAQAIAGSWAK